MLRHIWRQEPNRSEMILPMVNGYNVYKADLHTHTIYSDGNVAPKYRVREAPYIGIFFWIDSRRNILRFQLILNNKMG